VWVDPGDTGLASTVIADKGYPLHVAHTLVSEAVKLFAETYPSREYLRESVSDGYPWIEGYYCSKLDELFRTFINPARVGEIFESERELLLKSVTLKNMDDLLR